MEDISLMMSDYDVTMSSVQTKKVVESLLSSVTSLHSSTIHSKSTDNTENNPNITPPPPLKSYKTDTICTITCTDEVMTDKYVSTGPYESVSSSFGYPQIPTPPPNPSNLTPPTSPTKS